MKSFRMVKLFENQHRHRWSCMNFAAYLLNTRCPGDLAFCLVTFQIGTAIWLLAIYMWWLILSLAFGSQKCPCLDNEWSTCVNVNHSYILKLKAQSYFTYVLLISPCPTFCPRFSLSIGVFELQVILRQVHQMTPKLPWTVQDQMYPTICY